MTIRDWNPADGQAFQGDIVIMAVPDDIVIDTSDEIVPRDGRLIIQEGELSGHHHAIAVRNFRAGGVHVGDPSTATRDTKLRKALGGRTKPTEGTARFYRDPAAVQNMVQAGLLTRADLAIGILVVELGPVVIQHEEHDGICEPIGRYYLGRQVESVGAEQRVVVD